MIPFIVKVRTTQGTRVYQIDAENSFDVWQDAFESHRNVLSIEVKPRGAA